MRRATERRLVSSIALSGGLAAGIATRTFTGLHAHMVIRTHMAAPCKAVAPRSRLRHYELWAIPSDPFDSVSLLPAAFSACA